MTEREVFLKAIEITDKREREAFIAAACQGDSRLLSHITKLLETDSQSGEFLEVPAWERMVFTLGGNNLKTYCLSVSVIPTQNNLKKSNQITWIYLFFAPRRTRSALECWAITKSNR